MASSTSKSEQAYIQSSLRATQPLRADGRPLHAYRNIALQTAVAPLANGSARVSIGGVTEVVAASKLEVDDDDAVDGGRIVCTVSCSPSAYPHLSPSDLDSHQSDLTALLHTTLSSPSLLPPTLSIIPRYKSWTLHLDALVLADAGNVYDALFLAARAALCDTRVPRTRAIEYRRVRTGDSAAGDVRSGFDTRVDIEGGAGAVDFELVDYWDEGELLDGRAAWPVCVTLNILPPIHYLDATLHEESATPLRLLLMYSFSSVIPNSPSPEATLQGMRLLGPGELTFSSLKSLIKDGEGYAREMVRAFDRKIAEEEETRAGKARAKFAGR